MPTISYERDEDGEFQTVANFPSDHPRELFEQLREFAVPHLAAVRMLFDWLVTGQVVPTNPAAPVRGPKHVVKTGKTPVLEGAEWRKLLKSIPDTTLRDLRDRALIATLTYSFARINAALKMKVEDLRPRGAGWDGPAA